MEQSHAAEQPPQEQQGGPVRQNAPGQATPSEQAAPSPQQPPAQQEQQQRPDDPTAAQQDPTMAPQGQEPTEAERAQQRLADQPLAAAGESVPPGAEPAGLDAERIPAEDQAPVATEAGRTITGDPGFHEQVPQMSEGSPSAVDRPVGTSMPVPSAQSGMPLPEDRAAVEREREGESDQEAQQEARQ